MDNLPDWMKWAVILGAIFGTNGLQLLGLGLPAQNNATVAQSDRQWCIAELTRTQEELRKCWKECSR
jgi:hypothetical protein